MTSSNKHLTVTIPLAPSAHRIAEEFWEYHENIQKSNQVFLNSLAVYAVHLYMQCIEIETDLAASDSWKPMMQSLMDVADLYVKKLGRLECRPVLPDTRICNIPLEVLSDRIGYLVVLISESLREATILGFSETALTGYLEINQLRSLEDLLEHLEHLSSGAPIKIPVNLSQWLRNVFEVGWQSLESVLGTDPDNLTFSFRSRSQLSQAGVKRAKLIDLGMQLGGQQVALVVGLTPAAEPEMITWVEVYPTSSETYLPSALQVMVLDEEGLGVMEAQVRSTTNNIHLEFSVEPGERFSVKVALGDVSVTEAFLI